MAQLILGPTGSGKTTYINSLINKKIITYEDLIFGFEIKKSFFKIWSKGKRISKNSVVHYNILNSFTDLNKIKENKFLKNDKVLNNILSYKKVFDEVIVIVAPINELILRASVRKKIEEKIDGIYDKNFWIEVLKNIDLIDIYGQLFDILEKLEIKYKILFSSANDFKRINKDNILHNLKNI